MEDLILEDYQKEEILSLFDSGENNLLDITRKVFNNFVLDGRSREGRAVRTFLSSQGKEYKTTKSQSQTETEVLLTQTQKDFLLGDRVSSDMNALEITKIVFNNPEIKSLSIHHRVVLEFLTKYRKDILDGSTRPSDGKWYPPRTYFTTLRFVNRWTSESLGESYEELSSKNRRHIESLMKYLQVYKLELTLNSFKIQSDRDLFESEFVRSVWDKPDLTTDELNLYMMICSNHVRVKHIQIRLDGLNRQLAELDGEDTAPTMRLTEIIKATTDELNACEKRIESLTKGLNGDRSKRIEKQTQRNSFIELVEEFQREESRNRLVMVAKLQNQAVLEEANRLESVSEIKARIFGVSKGEII